MNKQDFINTYFSSDVPEWYKQFCNDLNSVIKNEIKKYVRRKNKERKHGN